MLESASEKQRISQKNRLTEAQIAVDLRDADHPAMSQPCHKKCVNPPNSD